MPGRNAQFAHVNAQRLSKTAGSPWVDTKKKELVGDFKNGGREWHRQGQSELIRAYDFVDKKLGKGIPYGVYDQTANMGWVSVGGTKWGLIFTPTPLTC